MPDVPKFISSPSIIERSEKNSTKPSLIELSEKNSTKPSSLEIPSSQQDSKQDSFLLEISERQEKRENEIRRRQ